MCFFSQNVLLRSHQEAAKHQKLAAYFGQLVMAESHSMKTLNEMLHDMLLVFGSLYFHERDEHLSCISYNYYCKNGVSICFRAMHLLYKFSKLERSTTFIFICSRTTRSPWKSEYFSWQILTDIELTEAENRFLFALHCGRLVILH